MDNEHPVCIECQESVPVTAQTCPYCGYDVGRHNRRRLYFGFVGTLLTLTVVLSPLGLPLLWVAHRDRKRTQGAAIGVESETLRAHLSAVLRHHLGLEPPVEPPVDFTRGDSSARPELSRPPKL